LDKKILSEYEKSKRRYGSPKITKVLRKQGLQVSQKRVARRMKEMYKMTLLLVLASLCHF